MVALEISTYPVLIWIVAVIIGSFSVAIFLGSKKYSSRVFAVSIFFVALWTANMGFNVGARDEAFMYWVLKISYVLGTIISGCFFYFCISYPTDRRPSKKLAYAIAFVVLLLSVFTISTDWISGDPLQVPGQKHFGWGNGPLWFLFDFVFSSFVLSGLVILLKKISYSKNLLEVKHLKIMFWSLLVGFIPPMVTDIILPRFGYSALSWIGPISGVIWVSIISYAIIRYQQMNVRLVFGQAVIVAMAILFFVNVFTDFGIGILGKVLAFIIFAVLGMFLFKSILNNQLQREQLKDLSYNLQKRVNEQTKEIQRAYEVEKKARIELQQLDQSKNDFIIITQHHLRTPLTQIRWYADSIISGLYGSVSSELRTAILRIDGATEKLIKTLNNFLEVVQMKIGVKFLKLEPLTLKPIVAGLLAEFSKEIGKKNISVTLPQEDRDATWPSVRADAERTKDALSILIDNAVRYNREKGSIIIETEQRRNVFILRISNTGLQIDAGAQARLFKQSFFRTEDARRVNPTGMGVGLLVAKTIIEAHKGSIAVETSGEGMTTFVVALPFSS